MQSNNRSGNAVGTIHEHWLKSLSDDGLRGLEQVVKWREEAENCEQQVEIIISSGRFLANAISVFAERAIEDGKTNSYSNEDILKLKAQFESIIEEIVTGDAILTIKKSTVLEIIEATFFIGTAVGESDIRPNLLSEFNDLQTLAARTKRRAEAVQTIIDDAAREYWAKHPAKAAKPSDTARAILRTVKAKLHELADLPREWQPDAWGDDKQMAERIRGRVRRIASPDNRQLSKKQGG